MTEYELMVRRALRDEVGRLTPVRSGSGGLEFEVWFCKKGYTPHYAEHVVDPVDGREKLVMFDPHTRRSALIYDLCDRAVEWEFGVPGVAKKNPHQGFMLMEDVEGFGDAGSVCCIDRDQNVIVVNRDKEVVFSKPPPFTPKYLHGVALGVDGASLIVADFTNHRVSKLALPGLEEAWYATVRYASKPSVIEGAGLEPDPSFGGHYLVPSLWRAAATPPSVVYELKDGDGSVAWRCPAEDLSGPWVTSAHSAFRMGRAENYGNVTVLGSEARGGIYAVDYYKRPVWGVSSGCLLKLATGEVRYGFSTRLGEVTHVFPTLNGRIGFVSWSGFNSSVVGVISHIPRRQEVEFVLAYEATTTDTWLYLDPPMMVEEWDEVLVVVVNTGAAGLDWKLDAYPHTFADLTAPERGRIPLLPSRTVAAGEYEEQLLTKPYKWYRLAVKSAVAGSPTTYDVYVTQRRR